MEPEAGSAPNGCTSTVKESEEQHNLEDCDNDGSCISGIKLISSMVVKKKRGRRAPPSSRRLSGNRVFSNEDAVDNCNHAKESQAGNSSDVALSPSSRKPEDQGQSANPKNLFEKATEMITESPTGCKKSFWEEKESDNKRGRQATLRAKHGGLDIETTGKGVSASEACENASTPEDTSAEFAAARSVNPEDNSVDPMDNVSDAHVITTSSEDKSSEEVEDVKVCDICGDVGEEERLAVCTRCNDGAEHIYCMKVMMEEVPEGEWLCEECKNELEFDKEKKKLEKSQLKVGASKGQFFERKPDKIANASSNSYDDEASESFQGKNSKLDTALKNKSSENGVKDEDGDNKELNSTNQCNNITMKRKDEGAEIISSIRQSIPERCGLSMGVEPRKRLPLSRESSFRLDVVKGKQSTTQVPTSLAFDAAKNLGPPLRGQFSKSTSFNNSKVPKVKQLVNEVPPKPNNLKDHLSYLAKKEGPVGILAKSPFFKKPKSCESGNKAKSSLLPLNEESKVMNPPVSHNVTSDRVTSILGCPSVTASMTNQASSKEESKAQHLATGNNMGDSNNLSITHGQGGRCSLGYSEVNKQPLAKAPGSKIVSSAEKSSSILGSGVQRKVIQNTDPAHQDDKANDPTSLRPGAISSNLTMRCQRCNEAGHYTQFCSVDKISLSAVKPVGERNMKDSSAKRNKTSEATNMISADKAAFRSVDQSENILKWGPCHNPTYRPKDPLSTSFGHVKKPSQLYGRTGEQDIRNTSNSRGSTDCSKLKPNECQPVSVMAGRFVYDSFTMPDSLVDKSNQVLIPGYGSKVSTVPELDFIWQGGFELRRTGRSPELCDGFQAHLSCSASPKVLEVAKKFPSKVQLEELPRLNSWPRQFQENGPSYENIGLFFFARDTDSYENHYSKLVENMLKNDLALRGTIETAELLIFPSNILSKNFQRWNMFYFLWGVFRVRKKGQMNIPPGVTLSTCKPNLNMDVDQSISILTSDHSLSEGQNNGDKSDHDLVKSVPCEDYQCPQTTGNPCADNQCPQTTGTDPQGCSNGENISNQPLRRNESKDHCHVSITASSSTNNSTQLATEQQKFSCSEDQDTKDSSNSNACEPMLDVNTVPLACSISSVCEKGKGIRAIDLNDADNLVDVDISTCEVNSGTVDPVSHITATPHKRSVEVANWVDEVNGKLEQKKIKLDYIGSANSSLSENTSDGRLSSKVHPLVSSSFDDSVDQSLAGSSKCNGKRIFSLDLNAMDDPVTGNVVNLSSDDEGMPERDVPDLELELGDNKFPRNTMFSFLPPKAGENQNKEHSLPTDTPGSLSLSLAFPASREHAGKLQPELQRQLPEMSSRNKISSIWDRQ
ncbi:uncharacterized protein LOC102710931 isoform X2 [Oryza brachyantha]|uniref:uncharacterized protein LOC102710931 isoform X2 n=1 Tax=Oryza brachyantha TaxID=4533 RepID=UPI0003EA87E4|nr:uncharacterized protein LOC102710931 isoform X2 [Oryza brachyantha]